MAETIIPEHGHDSRQRAADVQRGMLEFGNLIDKKGPKRVRDRDAVPGLELPETDLAGVKRQGGVSVE